MTKTKTFTREFKPKAVQPLELGKKIGTQLVRQLRVKRNQLYNWKKRLRHLPDWNYMMKC